MPQDEERLATRALAPTPAAPLGLLLEERTRRRARDRPQVLRSTPVDRVEVSRTAENVVLEAFRDGARVLSGTWHDDERRWWLAPVHARGIPDQWIQSGEVHVSAGGRHLLAQYNEDERHGVERMTAVSVTIGQYAVVWAPDGAVPPQSSTLSLSAYGATLEVGLPRQARNPQDEERLAMRAADASAPLVVQECGHRGQVLRTTHADMFEVQRAEGRARLRVWTTDAMVLTGAWDDEDMCWHAARPGHSARASDPDHWARSDHVYVCRQDGTPLSIRYVEGREHGPERLTGHGVTVRATNAMGNRLAATVSAKTVSARPAAAVLPLWDQGATLTIGPHGPARNPQDEERLARRAGGSLLDLEARWLAAPDDQEAERAWLDAWTAAGSPGRDPRVWPMPGDQVQAPVQSRYSRGDSWEEVRRYEVDRFIVPYMERTTSGEFEMTQPALRRTLLGTVTSRGHLLPPDPQRHGGLGWHLLPEPERWKDEVQLRSWRAWARAGTVVRRMPDPAEPDAVWGPSRRRRWNPQDEERLARRAGKPAQGPQELLPTVTWDDDEADPDVGQDDWNESVAMVARAMTELMDRAGGDGTWVHEYKDVGWRRASGTRTIEGEPARAVFLLLIPDRAPSRWRVWDKGDRVAVTVWHHDAPTGEKHVLRPATEEERGAQGNPQDEERLARRASPRRSADGEPRLEHWELDALDVFVAASEMAAGRGLPPSTWAQHAMDAVARVTAGVYLHASRPRPPEVLAVAAVMAWAGRLGAGAIQDELMLALRDKWFTGPDATAATRRLEQDAAMAPRAVPGSLMEAVVQALAAAVPAAEPWPDRPGTLAFAGNATRALHLVRSGFPGTADQLVQAIVPIWRRAMVAVRMPS